MENPGDIVYGYGDRDGVLIIPKEIEKEAFHAIPFSINPLTR